MQHFSNSFASKDLRWSKYDIKITIFSKKKSSFYWDRGKEITLKHVAIGQKTEQVLGGTTNLNYLVPILGTTLRFKPVQLKFQLLLSGALRCK